MRNLVWIILLIAAARAQKYRFCAPAEVNDATCISLQRGDSKVSCVHVADSAECAIRIAEGEADFGIFNAEELLLAVQFYPTVLQPILQLRHKEMQTEEFEFQTVAVIPADLTGMETAPGERVKRLRNAGLCHPGFSESQWWTDYILKHFENTVNPLQCQDNVTAIESELRNLRDFFGKACRPGEWVADISYDRELKRKYPELCALCDDTVNCRYSNRHHHGHYGALQCLTRGYGKVAYVALKYVQEYLKTNESFQFLCPSGTVESLSSNSPCAWLQQPWSVIVARKEIEDSLKPSLLDWLRNRSQSWHYDLSKIIQEDSWAFELPEKTSAITYLSKGREIVLDNIKTCGKNIRWCTISREETIKCKWVAKAVRALGIAPSISCIQSNSTFQCFRDIQENRTDIIVIDSNYGYLARTVHKLSTILYSETEDDKNSIILAIVPEPNGDNYPITGFQDLKGKRACFPEYSGISWLSFINTARVSDVVSSKSCDYPLLMSRLFSGACTPGIEDTDHSPNHVSSDIASKLCSSCRHQNNTSCAVNETNRYYGDKGAMRCIDEGAGDIAFVEYENIKDHIVDQHTYRVLCKNGSLAEKSGLNFDKFCALSITIDSEVVGRKNKDEQITELDTILALLKMENWLGYRANVRRPIHIYGPFNRTLNLLFKDSSAGLVSISLTKESVLAYKELFTHVETCNGSCAATVNFIFVALIALYHLLSNHVH
ncbi:hypothetical protein P5V15_007771 [Pogonomyrmex californicus]